jgi:hypothetical protein
MQRTDTWALNLDGMGAEMAKQHGGVRSGKGFR